MFSSEVSSFAYRKIKKPLQYVVACVSARALEVAEWKMLSR
jgi:hypothetical protein